MIKNIIEELQKLSSKIDDLKKEYTGSEEEIEEAYQNVTDAINTLSDIK